MSVNWETVYKLLQVVHDSRGLPTVKPLHDLAMKELEAMAKDAEKDLEQRVRKELEAKAEEERKKVAEEKRKLDEQQRKEAEDAKRYSERVRTESQQSSEPISEPRRGYEGQRRDELLSTQRPE